MPPSIRCSSASRPANVLTLAFWSSSTAGMGYGDVKLSGVIGMALAWLGWPVLLS